MAECYESVELLAVLDQVRVPQPFMLRRAFPNVFAFDKEQVEIQRATGGPRLAPFVAPCTEGTPIAERGWESSWFTPAYVKPLTMIDCCRPFRRQMGETCATQLTPQQRLNGHIARETREHQQMIENRLEWMACKALIDGQYVVDGEDYPATLVDFKRHPDLTVTLTGANTWNQPTSQPMDNLEDWRALMARTPGGAPGGLVVMGSDVWKWLRRHQDVNDLLNRDLAGQSGSFNRGPNGAPDAVNVGRLGALEFWTYDEWYEDENGVQQNYIPPGTVLLISTGGLFGTQAFGAIKDLEHLVPEVPYWPKMWTQPNPSAIFLATQSAPLVIPGSPNACMRATVL